MSQFPYHEVRVISPTGTYTEKPKQQKQKKKELNVKRLKSQHSEHMSIWYLCFPPSAGRAWSWAILYSLVIDRLISLSTFLEAAFLLWGPLREFSFKPVFPEGMSHGPPVSNRTIKRKSSRKQKFSTFNHQGVISVYRWTIEYTFFSSSLRMYWDAGLKTALRG